MEIDNRSKERSELAEKLDTFKGVDGVIRLTKEEALTNLCKSLVDLVSNTPNYTVDVEALAILAFSKKTIPGKKNYSELRSQVVIARQFVAAEQAKTDELIRRGGVDFSKPSSRPKV